MNDIAPRFHDGKTSSAQAVRLSLGDQSLLIYHGDILLAKWSYDKIHVKEDWNDKIGAIFGFKETPDAGLSVSHHSHFETIQKRLSQRNKASFIIPTKAKYLLLMLVGAVIAGFLLFPLISYTAEAVTYLIPRSVENKLGDTVLTEMKITLKSCEDEKAIAHLNKISERLMAASGYKDMKPDIRILKFYVPNAFSLPGNKIVVFDSFLQDAKSENEIAAVMAHEIGHMVKRDALESFVQAQGASIIIGLISSSGSYGDVAKFASVLQSMKYSRDKEFAADKFGAETLIKAGYSPSGLADFLGRMDGEIPAEKKEKDMMDKAVDALAFLSTHPETAERIKIINDLNAPKNYRPSLSAAEFKELQDACVRGSK